MRRKAEPFLRAADPGFEPASRTATRIELKNGSRIVALPADPDSIRGYSADELIIDEAARVDEELYAAARPMLAVTGGRLIALTTAAGPRGWFYRAWMDGGEDWRENPHPSKRMPAHGSRPARPRSARDDRSPLRRRVRLRVHRHDRRRLLRPPRRCRPRQTLVPLYHGGW